MGGGCEFFHVVQGGFLKNPLNLVAWCSFVFFEFVGEGMLFLGGEGMLCFLLFLRFPGPRVLQPGFGMWLEE